MPDKSILTRETLLNGEIERLVDDNQTRSLYKDIEVRCSNIRKKHSPLTLRLE